jgi:membrane protein DedA with SNARE-associated domain
VFAEDALFVGFVIPGETAAVLGGFLASRGHVSVVTLGVVVVLAAILGDTVGYEIGRHIGLVVWRIRKRRAKSAPETVSAEPITAIDLGDGGDVPCWCWKYVP